MLFCIQIINRADKAVLGIAATAIMADLSLSPERYGFVASSFFFLYSIGGIIVGYSFAHRFRPRIILAVLIAIWSASQLPIVFAASFGTLLVGRVLLGLGEGSGTPTCVNATHEWFPAERRNLPTSIVLVGTIIGAVVSAPVLSWVIHLYGWRAAFAACAIGGGLMLAIWLMFSRNGPYSGVSSDHGGAPAAGRQVLRMLGDRSVGGCFIMSWSTDWVVAFTIAWLPSFCTLVLGFSAVETGWLLSGVFVVQTVVILAASMISQWLLRRGFTQRTSLSGLIATCQLLGAACMLAGIYAGPPHLRLALIGLAIGLACVTSALTPGVLGAIFPTRHRNRLVHVVMSAGTIGALLAPWLTGHLLGRDTAGGWSSALLVNVAVLVIGGVSGLLIINPERSARRLQEMDARTTPILI